VLRVLGIVGSLRKGSYNRALLRAAVEFAPPELEIRVFEELAEIPSYDGDVESAGDPPPVAALKRAIAESDAVLIATPEYNHSIPGVLKNAIDWASRPAGQSVLRGKAAGMIGATTGNGATIRAQLALRQALDGVGGMYVMPEPNVLIARVGELFDAEGQLAHEATLRHLRTFLAAFAAWAERFRTSAAT
jgi:chromate reductase, NAD(P)H dehydrogenase (quinone)